mmetsp:Transcript_4324/g.8290  ORF Transcript_4324/g.8290 Transcript_4324/m.8290 type:complete len:680 (-) Transcript_4324:187-2226(-)|eukprot:CAMPEP_0176498990 /NCGR_PEP_ID=MMETSP0200_2-20121128/12659_1 /TAXON_ID=947934 /ORGANISM="Chaetoceros sp., Strain GSL56" /LENGTH=679 /DNA_ID=CAMNT_0017897321 /DNA_START=683 /DNA_END=2722 /DNA_ORIENTATION=+
MQDRDQSIHLSYVNAFLISGGIVSLAFSAIAVVMIQRRTQSSTNTAASCTGFNTAAPANDLNTAADVVPNSALVLVIDATNSGKPTANNTDLGPLDHAVTYDDNNVTRTGIKRRLSTPYRRLIFGLCASEILQSISFILGPFLVPRESILSSPWGIGNVSTCNMDGVLIIFGSAVSCMYTCSMCIYYYSKTVKDMSDRHFFEKIERKLHWFVLIFNIVFSVAAVSTKSINPVAHLGFCHFSRKPFACDPSIPRDCDRGEYAILFALAYIPLGVPALCLFINILCMIKVVLCYSSSRTENMLHYNHSTAENIPGVNSFNDEVDNNHDQGLSQYSRSAVAAMERMSRLLQREVIVQLSLHMLIFICVYGPHITAVLYRSYRPFRSSNSEIVAGADSLSRGFIVGRYAVAIIRPLGGFFNVLVCVRPQLLSCRRMHPNQSWIHVLYLFFKKGGQTSEKRDGLSSLSSRDICCCCIWSKKDDGMDISPVLRKIVEVQMSGESQYVSRPMYLLETTDAEGNSNMDPELRHQWQRTMHHHCDHDVDKSQGVRGISESDHSLDQNLKPSFSMEQNEIVTKAFERALERAKGLKTKCFNEDNPSLMTKQNDFVTKAFAKAFERVKHISQTGENERFRQQDAVASSGSNHDSSLIWSDRDSLRSSQLSSFQIDHDSSMGLQSVEEEKP